MKREFEADRYLKKAVEQLDYPEIRGAIRGRIVFDEYFETNDFDDAIKYALSHGVEEEKLYQPFDRGYGELKEEPEKWNEDYCDEARGAVELNFSKERIDHLKKVSRHLHKKKEKRGEKSSGKKYDTVQPEERGGAERYRNKRESCRTDNSAGRSDNCNGNYYKGGGTNVKKETDSAEKDRANGFMEKIKGGWKKVRGFIS